MDLLDVVGTWSVDAQYGPGAMSDYRLHLRADGLGCLEYASLAGATVVVIRWSLSDDRLTTTTLGTYATPPGKYEPFDVDPDGGGLDLHGVPVTVGQEDTLAGSPMRILRFPPGTEHGLLESFAHVGEEPPPGTTALMDLHAAQ